MVMCLSFVTLTASFQQTKSMGKIAGDCQLKHVIVGEHGIHVTTTTGTAASAIISLCMVTLYDHVF